MEEQGNGANTEEEQLQRAAAELAQVQTRIGQRFRRAEARLRAGRFLQGLLAPVERKNGWQMAEELGEQGPRGVQRLLGEADWDEEAVRDDLRGYVVEHLGEEHGVLVVDETGFVKKGTKSAGVARQYSGTAGRRENSQIGVFLLYASTQGAAFLDRALSLPEEWMVDRVRCREAGIPDEIGIATKGALARQMLSRAFAAGVPAEWIAGDTVYGYDDMCLWLDEQQKNYVLAVPETYVVWVQGRQHPIGLLASLLPREAWVVLSAGEGSKGPRLYEWAWLQLPEHTEKGSERGRWILIRRSLADPSKRAYYRVAGPATTTLPELVRVAGSRWKIEEGFEEAKGEVGLDQYEVRGFQAWYRFVTLALFAHAILVAVRAQASTQKKKSGTGQATPQLSVSELRRLIHILQEPEEQRGRRLWWSRFRRRHQAKARECHVQRRARQAPRIASYVPEPIRLPGLPALTDAQWEQLYPLLPAQKPHTGRPATDHRLVVEGMLWVVRTGSSWRELPERFGPWSTVASRSQRWWKAGIWAQLLHVLQTDEIPISSSA